jgi:predicted ATPase/DNA-binding CsgD family transcriptional regulator
MARLPADTTSFVGRRRELAEARRLLSRTRLLTLTGAGGVGKTRLALRLAGQLRAAFPDGVHLVELGSLHDPALLAQTVATEFGLRDASVEPAARLAEYLEDKRLLLVLDNCEHLAEACAVLVGKLLTTVPELRVLATTRHVLGIEGEQVLRVPPLGLPDDLDKVGRSDAVSLFVERAAAVAPDFVLDDRNREQVVAICRRLDGIPLAIELAAVWVKRLSLAEILDRLDDRFTLLTGGSRTAPSRQQTLAGTIDWSYQLCSPAQRLLWARLSVFAGDFDLEAVEEVCADGQLARADILELVAALVDKSILVRHPDTHGHAARYRMLETIRQFGWDRLVASGQQTTLRRRHAEYYQALARRYRAESFGPDQLEWIQRMLREHANVRMAVELGLTGAGPVEVTTEIAAALWNFWFAGGFLREGYRWLVRVLEADTAPTRRRGHALWAAAFLGTHLGEPDAAGRMLAECAELADRFDDPELRAYHAESAGLAALHGGDLATARELLTTAVAAHRATGDLLGVADSLILLAGATLFLGDPRGAAAAAECLELCQAHDATWTRAYALWAVAIHRWRTGRCEDAAALLAEGVRLQRASRDWTGLAYLLEVLAWCASGAGEHDRAARLLGGTTSVWRLSGARTNEAPPYHAVDSQTAEQARAALGAARYQEEFAKGLESGVDEMISEALRERGADARPGPRAGTGTPLTPRELQIAELVAEGLTNREIASRLVIAQRTAETHVENALSKLGFTSRAQIATWVAGRRTPGQPID